MPLVSTLLVGTTALLLMTPYYALAPLPAIALLAFVFLIRNPAAGYYLIVFLIPFGAYRKLGDNVNLPWIVALLVLVALGGRLTLQKSLPPNLSSNLWPPMILYFGVCLISTVMSDFPPIAWSHVGLLGAAYLFVFMGLACMEADGIRRVLPGVLVTSVALSSLLAVGGFYLGLSSFSEAHDSGLVTRAVGGAIDPNNLSLMTIFGLPIVVHLAVHLRRPAMRLFMLAIIPLCVMAIVTTHSRSGLLILCVAALLLAVHYRRMLSPRRLGLVLIAGMVGATILAPAIPQSFWERQASLVAWGDNSLLRRSSYLEVANQAFVDSPLFGYGPGTFVEIYRHSEDARQFTRQEARLGRRAHNTYLEVLVGTGTLGLLIFLVLLARAFLNYRQAERGFRAAGDDEMANLAASYGISFLSLLAFLAVFSEMYHKYMLLALPLSQALLTAARARAGVR